ncbi:dnaJ homolog subfamily B member 5-like [Camellia sinensis]|uniref:dnaJ homolog subfamily B member 5-like n=1 Tax=Camellia sinensis TaxID=4442 RepID=UPI00103634D8|nr:dnaJ homolog subfamily B member 5-like [Camellia sinensis]
MIRDYRCLVEAATHLENNMQAEKKRMRGSKRSQDSQGDGKRQRGSNPQSSQGAQLRRLVQESEILTIEVKPGWKKGTKITFPDKGNEQLNQLPADLVFVIDEKPHSIFTRDSNDLIMSHRVTLAEALGGTTVSLTTLDGRNLLIPVTDLVSPAYEMVVAREGMPITKERGNRGDLRIKFEVKFPTKLTPEQRSGLRRVLGGYYMCCAFDINVYLMSGCGGGRRDRPRRQEMPIPDDIPAQEEGVSQANVAELVSQQAMDALAREMAGALRESMDILRVENQV